MSARALGADVPFPCGHPRVSKNCRVCDRDKARTRKLARLSRIQRGPAVALRHGRPVLSSRVVALIDECRPAYLAAIGGRA